MKAKYNKKIIYYTSTDGNIVAPYNTTAFGAAILSNTYTEGEGKMVFDNTVTSLGDIVFYDCTRLSSITIPDKVTSIEEYVFWHCISLSSVTIPDSVTSIGEDAFDGCSSLSSVTIPNSVTTIGDFAFFDCTSLSSITIPDSVTSIGYYAFYDCIILSTINYNGTKEQWNEITKGTGWNNGITATTVHCTDGDL